MGQPQIQDKLRREFRKGIRNESQVVYVLVEIGKLLEQTKQKDKYPIINFYRNWVVHSKLTSSAMASNIVFDFDEFIKTGNTVLPSQLKEMVSPKGLLEEMNKLLTIHKIRFPAYKNRKAWKTFIKHLAEVIVEVPLHFIPAKPAQPAMPEQIRVPPQYVETVTVKRDRNHEDRAMLTWTANCNGAQPAGVETEIQVVLYEDKDFVAWRSPAPKDP